MADVRLSPAEAHEILRRYFERQARSGGLAAPRPRPVYWQVRTQAYAPGEVIIPRHARTDALGLVVRGYVAVHTTPRADGRPHVVLTPGHTFGQALSAPGRPAAPSAASVGLQNAQPVGATLKALTRCEIWFATLADQPGGMPALKEGKQAARERYRLGRIPLLLAVAVVAILAVCLPPGRPAAALLPEAVAYWCDRQGADNCAEQAWYVAAAMAPADADPFLALGILYVEHGDLSAAEQAFAAALSRAPGSPEAYNNLGFISLRRGDLERAANAFHQALDLDPGSAAVEQNVALSLARLGRYGEAATHYESALTLGRPQAGTWLNVATADYATGRLAEAADAAHQALHYDSTMAPAHTLLGAVSLELRRPEEALVSLRQAVGLDAADPQAHFYLGLAYQALDQPAAAAAAFQQALAVADDENTKSRIQRHLDTLAELETAAPN